MAKDFAFDVFIGHGLRDKAAVRKLVERLTSDGKRVWFDKLSSASSGVESSRAFVLVMSANLTASEWAQLEAQSILFRDASQVERRFVPLRLDNAELKESFSHYAYVDWRKE